MSSFKGGGPVALTASRIKNASLPTEITCTVCKRQRARMHFSNKQLEVLRFQVLSGSATNKGSARCRDCTGRQTVELQCTQCGQIKDLNEFAKAQRKKPDAAKCCLCMENVLATEPDDYRPDQDFDFEDDDDNLYGTSYMDDDLCSESTGISNPWAMRDDGDYLTESDAASGILAASEKHASMGTTGTHAQTRHSSLRHSSIASKNLDALNGNSNPPLAGSFATSSSAPDSSLAYPNIMDMSIKEGSNNAHDDDDDEIDGELERMQPNGSDLPARHLFAMPGRKGLRETGQETDDRGFNAWGPQGQHTIHHRAPSTASSLSGSCQLHDASRDTKTVSPGTIKKESKFAKVRPENKMGPSPLAKDAVGDDHTW